MKKIILYILIILILVSSMTAFGGNDIKYVLDIEGYWESDSGDLMFISQKGGFLDIQGKDSASFYQSTCITQKNAAECIGHGIQFVEQRRFLYKSTFKIILEEKGNKIIEESWEGKFANGETVIGKTKFQLKRKNENGER